ncbi:hypothetical protein [Flavobacterium johnsoniae]|uniref:hypothetical protein n=1 Tax=Flavobacterium johnsoniae TaxID=986 RepID=UPI0009342841|nr:hypothetical protein [Flavobacterium johnsoniae]
MKIHTQKIAEKNELVLWEDVFKSLNQYWNSKSISDYLESWNFLTGGIKMSLKNAILYNFFLLLFFGFLCQYLQFTGNSLTNLFLTFIGWVLLFSAFYLIKLEGFKLQLKTIIK